MTCSASLAVAQVGVAVPGVSDTPITTTNQTTNAPADQTNAGNTTNPNDPNSTNQSAQRSLSPVIPLPPGTTVANPSTQLIPGASDTFAGVTGPTYAASNGAFFGGGAPGGDELGITVGAFRLFPAIDISTGVDNNVFTTNNVTSNTTAPSVSLSTVISPSMALRSEWLNHSINFLLGGGFGYYWSAPTQNYQNYFLIVDGRIDVREDLAVTYSFGYRRATEALGTANVTFAQAPTVAESIPIQLSLQKRFNRVTVEVGGSATRNWFTDYSTITSGSLDAQSRNRNAFEEHFRFGYEVTDDFTVYFTPSISQIIYDQNPDTLGQDRNSTQAGLSIGASWTINAISSVAGGVGIASNSGALGTTTATTFALTGSWNGWQPLTLRPNLSRGITETALAAYRNTISTVLGVDYTYQLFDEYAIVGGFSYTLADYVPTNISGVSPREDAFGRAAIGFAWSPRPQFSIGPYFEYTTGASTDPTGPAYNRQILSIRLSARR